MTKASIRAGESPNERIVEFQEEQTAEIILKPTCAADWHGVPIPPREWVWKSWLPRGTVTGLSGPPGAAKSTLAQQLCTHLALGRPFLDADIPLGTAFYGTCEDDLPELQRRQVRINTALGIEMNDIPDLYLDSWVGEDTQLVSVFSGIFTRTPRFLALDEMIGDLKADLVVLDLLPDMWNGNESDRQAVNGFVKSHLAYLARRHNSALLGLYHPSLSGMASGTGTSGSTAWEGSFRSRLYLDRPDTESDTRTLKRMKANYAGLGEQQLVWVDGYLQPESALSKTPQEENQEYWKTAFLTCLQHCNAKGIEVSPSPNSGHYYGNHFPDLWTNLDRRRRKVTRKQFEIVYTILVVVDEAVTIDKDPRQRRGDRLAFVGYST